MTHRFSVSLLATALCLLVFSPGMCGKPLPPYSRKALIELASEQKLWQRQYWQLLLHRESPAKGKPSTIDDPAFFLAEKGKYDSEAELYATLGALLLQPEKGREHAFDRFPARCEWLVQSLALDRARLPVGCCREVEKIIAGINPQAAVLVFPNAYMNTPASMFGHTLLAIRGNDPELLNQAVNYSAFTREKNGILFAFKGVLGFYDGFYSVTPYYQKIQEYNDMNMRDIWEYELNLTRPELERMMRHIWELHEISADYYFFSENCSYNLLVLLDLARPGQALYKAARPWVIPLDTVKLVRKKGLINSSRYRPSRATRLRSLGAAAGENERQLALRIADGFVTPGDAIAKVESPVAKARVLDLATMLLQIRRVRKKMDRKTYSKRFLKCLSARSRLPVAADEVDMEIPRPVAPDLGHGSFRISVGGGRDDGENFVSLGIRPAYHSLDDPAGGYVAGAEVRFADLKLRLAESDELPELQRLDAICIRSLSPRGSFFKPVSWEANASFAKDWVAAGERQYFADLGFGFGHTYSLPLDGRVYLLPRGELRIGNFAPAYSLGAGLKAGAWIRPQKRLRIGTEAEAIGFFAGDRYGMLSASLEMDATLTSNLSLRTGVCLRRIDGEAKNEFHLSLRAYF